MQTSATTGSLRRMTISSALEATNSPTTGSRPVSLYGMGTADGASTCIYPAALL
jgi:hypothetical protein